MPVGVAWGMFLATAAACLSLVLAALALPAGPTMGRHWDLAKALLGEGGIATVWDEASRGQASLLATHWDAWALALNGPVAVQLLHAALVALLSLAAVVLATPIVGRPWAWLVVPVVLLVPAAEQPGGPSDAILLSVGATLALTAWWRGTIEGRSGAWLVAGAVMAAVALDARPFAAAYFAAMAVSVTWAWLHQPHRRRILTIGTASLLVAVAAMGVPRYAGLLAEAAGWNAGDFNGCSGEIAPGERQLSFAMTPDRHAAAYGLGAMLPAAVPGVLIARRLRGLGVLFAVACVYAAIWYGAESDPQLLLAVVPAVAVAAVWVWMEMRRMAPGPRRLAAGAFAGLIALAAGTTLYEVRDRVAVAMGWESREEYLSRCEPTWQAAEISNRVFPASARLLSDTPRLFYFNCRSACADGYRPRPCEGAHPAGRNPWALEFEEGEFTHVLLVDDVEAGPCAGSLSQYVDAVGAGGTGSDLVKLLEYETAPAGGRVQRFRLMALRRNR